MPRLTLPAVDVRIVCAAPHFVAVHPIGWLSVALSGDVMESVCAMSVSYFEDAASCGGNKILSIRAISQPLVNLSYSINFLVIYFFQHNAAVQFLVLYLFEKVLAFWIPLKL